MEPSRKPLNVLIKNVGGDILINLKGHGEYYGKMTRVDGFMNVMLAGAKEYERGSLIANYGDVFVRGSNIVYICIDPIGPPKSKNVREKSDEDEESG